MRGKAWGQTIGFPPRVFFRLNILFSSGLTFPQPVVPSRQVGIPDSTLDKWLMRLVTCGWDQSCMHYSQEGNLVPRIPAMLHFLHIPHPGAPIFLLEKKSSCLSGVLRNGSTVFWDNWTLISILYKVDIFVPFSPQWSMRNHSGRKVCHSSSCVKMYNS